MRSTPLATIDVDESQSRVPSDPSALERPRLQPAEASKTASRAIGFVVADAMHTGTLFVFEVNQGGTYETKPLTCTSALRANARLGSRSDVQGYCLQSPDGKRSANPLKREALASVVAQAVKPAYTSGVGASLGHSGESFPPREHPAVAANLPWRLRANTDSRRLLPRPTRAEVASFTLGRSRRAASTGEPSSSIARVEATKRMPGSRTSD
jgi:hypothetical protein